MINISSNRYESNGPIQIYHIRGAGLLERTGLQGPTLGGVSVQVWTCWRFCWAQVDPRWSRNVRTGTNICNHWVWSLNLKFGAQIEAGGLRRRPEADGAWLGGAHHGPNIRSNSAWTEPTAKTGSFHRPEGMGPFQKSPFLSNCDCRWSGMIPPKSWGLLGSEGPDYWFWWGRATACRNIFKHRLHSLPPLLRSHSLARFGPRKSR